MSTESYPPDQSPTPPVGLDRALKRLAVLAAAAESDDDDDGVVGETSASKFTFGDALLIHRHVQNLEELGGEAINAESNKIQNQATLAVRGILDAMGVDPTERIQAVQVAHGNETALHIGITREVMRLGQPALEIHLPERRQAGRLFAPFTFTVSRNYILRRYDVPPEEAARLLVHQTPFGPSQELPGTMFMRRREGAGIDRPTAARLLGLRLAELHAIESGEVDPPEGAPDSLWHSLQEALRAAERAAERAEAERAEAEREAQRVELESMVVALAQSPGIDEAMARRLVEEPSRAGTEVRPITPASAAAGARPGERVERLRRHLGLSTAEAAERLGFTVDQLVRLESCAFQIDDEYATRLIAKLRAPRGP